MTGPMFYNTLIRNEGIESAIIRVSYTALGFSDSEGDTLDPKFVRFSRDRGMTSFNYDVFISFRGEDTRYSFTGHLYNALSQKGIRTFIDDHQVGSEITPPLVKAIEESRIFLIILSENYASSSFCLDELAKILDCAKGNGHFVLPVFYYVDPSEVRHQSGTYGEALARHEDRFKDNNQKVQKWRMALQQVANFPGWDFTHGGAYEYKIIQKIVDDVSTKIDTATSLHVVDYLVGLEPRVLQLNHLLDFRSGDSVHMVGIWGMSGIGKTTLAQKVYNLIADQFDGSCFLDVRQKSTKPVLVHLQESLLFEIVGDKHITLENVSQGIQMLKQRLCQKKVLLVIDNVDRLLQLQAIVGGPDWFGPGSRVIITTRDKNLLTTHGVERIYEVEKLNKKEALELLSWKAFKSGKIDPSLADQLKRAIFYASGLPLALEVIGSHLFGKVIEEWESALDRYERIPHNNIQEILKVSFDALGEKEQSVFLDIACFFKGYKLAEVEDMLCAHYGDRMKYQIRVLVDKCLLKIDEKGRMTLNDLIEDMAREIVQLESLKNPGSGSRFWFPEDIFKA